MNQGQQRDSVHFVDSPELFERIRGESGLRAGPEEARVVDQEVDPAVPGEDPDLMSARALYRLTWPTKVADAKTIMIETRAAQALLEKAVAKDPLDVSLSTLSRVWLR